MVVASDEKLLYVVPLPVLKQLAPRIRGKAWRRFILCLHFATRLRRDDHRHRCFYCLSSTNSQHDIRISAFLHRGA
jgi:hypothetical protein